MKWINDVVFAILAAHVWGSLMLFVAECCAETGPDIPG